MNWWDSANKPVSVDSATDRSTGNKKSRKKKGSDGFRQIAPNHSKKLLPIPKALSTAQTRLSERDIRSFMQAYQKSVRQADPKPLMDWLKQHNVREVSVETAIPHGTEKSKSTPLRNRSVSQVHADKIRHVAAQFIKNHMRAQTFKDASGNMSASARVNPALREKRRRKSAKNDASDGESNFITNRENGAPDTIEQREIEEGLDSIRHTPKSISPDE